MREQELIKQLRSLIGTGARIAVLFEAGNSCRILTTKGYVVDEYNGMVGMKPYAKSQTSYVDVKGILGIKAASNSTEEIWGPQLKRMNELAIQVQAEQVE